MSKRTKEGDEALRKKRAKLRFKRLVRVAMANTQWIIEAEEQQGITLNVKKNVAMLVRKKHKTGILTTAQKGLLASPHKSRSIDERKTLCLIVAGLGCFTQIPPILRARLVPHLLFMSVNAGRVFVKEGDVPTAVYFVVSGEVEMSRKIWNKGARRFETKPEAFLGPGDWIGEVELLEVDLRMNTFTAITNCEILVLDDDDFKSLLRPHVKKVWIEKKKAIASLSYLKFMTNSQVVSACKFGLIRQYDPLSTIFPEEKDSILHVHFVLSGECVLLQCLNMKVAVVKGELQYELPPIVHVDSDNVDDEKPEPFDVRELLRSLSSLDELGLNKKKLKRKAEFAKIEQRCKMLNQKPAPVEDPVPHVHHYHIRKTVAPKSIFAAAGGLDDSDDLEEYEEYEDIYSLDDITPGSVQIESTSQFHQRSSKSSKLSRSKSLLEEESEGSEIFTASSHSPTSSTSSVKSVKPVKSTKNYATHFIDIGSMTFGGLCGVGEKSDHRVIMARTTVQCLLIPRYWLMEEEQNPGHIWQRMRFYLDRCIPSRETLFKDFINTRKWAQFKEDCVEQFTHSTNNPTKIEDIPPIIRIIEAKETHEPDWSI